MIRTSDRCSVGAAQSVYMLVSPWEADTIGGVNQVVTNLYRQIQQAGKWRPALLVLDWASSSPQEGLRGGGERGIHIKTTLEGPILRNQADKLVHKIYPYAANRADSATSHAQEACG